VEQPKGAQVTLYIAFCFLAFVAGFYFMNAGDPDAKKSNKFAVMQLTVIGFMTAVLVIGGLLLKAST
jgi:hypothetical protein